VIGVTFSSCGRHHLADLLNPFPMKLHLLPLLATLACTTALQAQVTVDWTQPVGGLSIALDPQNNVFGVNYDYNLGGDITLTKHASDGTLLWDTAFDQTSTTMFDRATWVATDQVGNAIVSGTVMSGYSNPVNANSLVMKFDPSGGLLWRNEYETFFDGSYTTKCIVDKANAIYVLGLGTGPNGQVTTVKKFAPDGTDLWSWFDVGIGAPVNIKFTPDSELVIVHRALFGSLNGYSRIDRNGNTLWSLGGVNSLTVGDAAGDAFGNTYVVHGDYLGGLGSVIKKLSPSGALLWEYVYPITAFRVEVGSDNAPVICGFPFNGSGGSAFLKADASGTQLWLNTDADGPNNFLLHAQMMMDGADNAYLCAGTLFAMGICRVNSDGVTAWYITAGSGNSQGFALGNDDNVYAIGGSTLRLGQSISTGLPQGVWEVESARAHPVPASHQLTVEWPGHAITRWRILSVTGAVVQEGAWTSGPLDLDRVPSGPYLVQLTDATGARTVVRALKE